MLAYYKFNNSITIIPWVPLTSEVLAHHPIETETVQLTSTMTKDIMFKISEADKTIINHIKELVNKKGVKMV